jgi:hypothetical protein
MMFGVKVNDRSQCFSFTQMNAEQDRNAFADSLRRQLILPDLILEDLIASANETLEFVIAPSAIEFFPLSSLPPDTEMTSGPQEPVVAQSDES